jgi:hypothetical protein
MFLTFVFFSEQPGKKISQSGSPACFHKNPFHNKLFTYYRELFHLYSLFQLISNLTAFSQYRVLPVLRKSVGFQRKKKQL